MRTILRCARVVTLFAMVVAGMVAATPADARQPEPRPADVSAPTVGRDVDLTAANPLTFRNPIREGAADPQMVYDSGQYHLTYTAGNKIIIVSAASVANLATAPARTVWTDPTASRCCKMWAPEIHKINGKWYIYYTAGTATAELDTQRSHVIEATSLTGAWTYKGKLATQDDFAIDGTVATMPDGKLYYFWSQIHQGVPQSTYVSLMSNPWTLTGTKTRISTPDQGWEKHEGQVNEGPYVLVRNGKAWVFYSGSQCKSQYYAVGRLNWNGGNPVSASSWSKTGPVFAKSEDNHVFGPGHNSLFTSPDGTETWNLYHAVTSRDGSPVGSCGGDRSARIQKVTFDASGVPQLGRPANSWTHLSLPGGDPGAAPLANGRYQINPKDIPGATLDVLDCNKADNVPVTVYKNFPSACQYWNITYLNDGSGTYKIINAHSGRALDVYGCSPDNGAKIQQFGYWGADCQKWFIDKVSGGYRLQARGGGKALSVSGCSKSTERVALQTWWYYQAGCQKWNLVKA
ncbi:family 43 glycosylhydrolase [Propionibacteriaceae bacterium Y1685]|uniref:family 43 glycosylhydrolase n=1 Tax=Microlunatus sp. Y1700 TaxID=3418487 RepID=UPI003B7BF17E